MLADSFARTVPPPASLRARLRAATASQHAALDHELSDGGFFDSVDGYRQFLLRSWSFQTAVENALDAAGATRLMPDWPLRRRAPLLERDLAALRLSPPSTAAAFEPALQGDAAILGAAYVLEGSTLGGRVLLRRLAPLGFDAQRGAAFLDGHGAVLGRRWSEFLGYLEAHDSPAFSLVSAIDAGRAVFDFARACYARAAT